MSRHLDPYRPLLSLTDFAQLEAAIQRPLPPAIRVNTLKTNTDEARHKWPAWYGWQVEPVPFCATGWQIIGGGDNLSRTIEHRMGLYYIQDAASMLPAEMFTYDVARPLMLDMAASPGGKTTHLVCKTNDAGLILANDTSTGRIGALRSNLQAWGAIGTAITNFPGERFGNWFPETFDGVLLDAPCSGESLRTAERRKTRPVSAAERNQLHHRQVRLLISAFQALKPGGQVVYATCTLAPEEDEAVVDALLREFPHQAGVEAVDRLLPIPAPALSSDDEHTFDPQIPRAIRLWPHLYDTSGFFAALIRKRDNVSTQAHAAPRRSLAQAGFERLTQQQQAHVATQLLHEYGFDLSDVINRQRLTLWQRRRFVYAITELYVERFPDLSCAAIGMLIGENTEGFVPSHDLVSRFDAQFSGRRYRLADDRIDKWLAGYDLRQPGDVPYPTGTVIIVEDEKGRFVGRGKVLNERVRNMLPKK
ncbi:MAG TPA: NOL1/NOP2/sun family putative RNA methylase [Anaerolineae bacterium]